MKYIIRKFRKYLSKMYLILNNIEIGQNVLLAGFPIISKKNTIIIGNNVYIGKNAHFGADIEIADDVMIASQVSFVGSDHRYDQPGIKMIDTKHGDDRKIFVGRDVWIGHGSIILAGTFIGEGSIIGAGSVVTKSIDDYMIVGGNPAKIIKSRFTTSEIALHRKELLKK